MPEPTSTSTIHPKSTSDPNPTEEGGHHKSPTDAPTNPEFSATSSNTEHIPPTTNLKVVEKKKWKHGFLLNTQGLYTNTRKDKLETIKDMLTDRNGVFFAITETWLNDKIDNSEISIEGYNLFRCDRSQRANGGSALYIKGNLCTKEVLNISNSFCEAIVVTITELKLILGVIYRPPKCPYDKFQSVMLKIQDSITKITEKSED